MLRTCENDDGDILVDVRCSQPRRQMRENGLHHAHVVERRRISSRPQRGQELSKNLEGRIFFARCGPFFVNDLNKYGPLRSIKSVNRPIFHRRLMHEMLKETPQHYYC